MRTLSVSLFTGVSSLSVLSFFYQLSSFLGARGVTLLRNVTIRVEYGMGEREVIRGIIREVNRSELLAEWASTSLRDYGGSFWEPQEKSR